jgi:hypothetical protein
MEALIALLLTVHINLADLNKSVAKEFGKVTDLPTIVFMTPEQLPKIGERPVRGLYLGDQKVVVLNEDTWDKGVLAHELAHHAGANEKQAEAIEKKYRL